MPSLQAANELIGSVIHAVDERHAVALIGKYFLNHKDTKTQPSKNALCLSVFVVKKNLNYQVKNRKKGRYFGFSTAAP